MEKRRRLMYVPKELQGYSPATLRCAKYPFWEMLRCGAREMVDATILSDVVLIIDTHFNPATKNTVPCLMDKTGSCELHTKLRLETCGYLCVKVSVDKPKRILHLPESGVLSCPELTEKKVVFGRRIQATRLDFGKRKRVAARLLPGTDTRYEEDKMVSHHWLWAVLMNMWGIEFTNDPSEVHDQV